MGDIWNALATGGSKERLSVLSDIFTIMGISIASVGGGILAFLNKNPRVSLEAIVGATIFTIVYIGVFALGLALIVYLLSKVNGVIISVARWIRLLILAGVWSFALAAVMLAVWMYYSIMVSASFV